MDFYQMSDKGDQRMSSCLRSTAEGSRVGAQGGEKKDVPTITYKIPNAVSKQRKRKSTDRSANTSGTRSKVRRRELQCSVCSYIFHDKFHMFIHELAHGHCSLCNRTFSKRNAFLDHRSRHKDPRQQQERQIKILEQANERYTPISTDTLMQAIDQHNPVKTSTYTKASISDPSLQATSIHTEEQTTGTNTVSMFPSSLIIKNPILPSTKLPRGEHSARLINDINYRIMNGQPDQRNGELYDNILEQTQHNSLTSTSKKETKSYHNAVEEESRVALKEISKPTLELGLQPEDVDPQRTETTQEEHCETFLITEIDCEVMDETFTCSVCRRTFQNSSLKFEPEINNNHCNACRMAIKGSTRLIKNKLKHVLPDRHLSRKSTLDPSMKENHDPKNEDFNNNCMASVNKSQSQPESEVLSSKATKHLENGPRRVQDLPTNTSSLATYVGVLDKKLHNLSHGCDTLDNIYTIFDSDTSNLCLEHSGFTDDIDMSDTPKPENADDKSLGQTDPKYATLSNDMYMSRTLNCPSVTQRDSFQIENGNFFTMNNQHDAEDKQRKEVLDFNVVQIVSEEHYNHHHSAQIAILDKENNNREGSTVDAATLMELKDEGLLPKSERHLHCPISAPRDTTDAMLHVSILTNVINDAVRETVEKAKQALDSASSTLDAMKMKHATEEEGHEQGRIKEGDDISHLSDIPVCAERCLPHVDITHEISPECRNPSQNEMQSGGFVRQSTALDRGGGEDIATENEGHDLKDKTNTINSQICEKAPTYSWPVFSSKTDHRSDQGCLSTVQSHRNGQEDFLTQPPGDDLRSQALDTSSTKVLLVDERMHEEGGDNIKCIIGNYCSEQKLSRVTPARSEMSSFDCWSEDDSPAISNNLSETDSYPVTLSKRRRLMVTLDQPNPSASTIQHQPNALLIATDSGVNSANCPLRVLDSNVQRVKSSHNSTTPISQSINSSQRPAVLTSQSSTSHPRITAFTSQSVCSPSTTGALKSQKVNSNITTSAPASSISPCQRMSALKSQCICSSNRTAALPSPSVNLRHRSTASQSVTSSHTTEVLVSGSVNSPQRTAILASQGVDIPHRTTSLTAHSVNSLCRSATFTPQRVKSPKKKLASTSQSINAPHRTASPKCRIGNTNFSHFLTNFTLLNSVAAPTPQSVRSPDRRAACASQRVNSSLQIAKNPTSQRVTTPHSLAVSAQLCANSPQHTANLTSTSLNLNQLPVVCTPQNVTSSYNLIGSSLVNANSLEWASHLAVQSVSSAFYTAAPVLQGVNLSLTQNVVRSTVQSQQAVVPSSISHDSQLPPSSTVSHFANHQRLASSTALSPAFAMSGSKTVLGIQSSNSGTPPLSVVHSPFIQQNQQLSAISGQNYGQQQNEHCSRELIQQSQNITGQIFGYCPNQQSVGIQSTCQQQLQHSPENQGFPYNNHELQAMSLPTYLPLNTHPLVGDLSSQIQNVQYVPVEMPDNATSNYNGPSVSTLEPQNVRYPPLVEPDKIVPNYDRMDISGTQFQNVQYLPVEVPENALSSHNQSNIPASQSQNVQCLPVAMFSNSIPNYNRPSMSRPILPIELLNNKQINLNDFKMLYGLELQLLKRFRACKVCNIVLSHECSLLHHEISFKHCSECCVSFATEVDFLQHNAGHTYPLQYHLRPNDFMNRCLNQCTTFSARRYINGETMRFLQQHQLVPALR